jgi:hypothetical protein
MACTGGHGWGSRTRKRPGAPLGGPPESCARVRRKNRPPRRQVGVYCRLAGKATWQSWFNGYSRGPGSTGAGWKRDLSSARFQIIINYGEACTLDRARKVARMGFTRLDPDLSSNGTPAAGREILAPAVSEPGDKTRAVADLLQNKFLSRTFGIQGEWEVRTTLVAHRQAWRYQSSVFLRGKEIKKGWTQRIRQAKTVTEETLAAFAGEAVEVHFARCANVADYSMIAAIYSEPLPHHERMKRVALILLSIAVLFTAFGLWTISRKGGPVQADREAPAPGVSWQSRQVSYQSPAGEPFMFPLPPLARLPEGIPVDVTLETSGDKPGWLQLDPAHLTIGGTPPYTADDRTFQLRIRAQAEQGSDSSLLVVLTISGQPDQSTVTRQLPGHWAW